MPSLIRFIIFLAVLAGIGFAGIYSLATFVKPEQSEMTIRIPAEKLNPKPTDTGG